MLAGQVTGKAGLFISLMIYSRIFTDGEFGELLFAVAISLILFFLADMGASLVTTRRLVHSERTVEFLSQALQLRTILSGVSLIALAVFTLFMGYPETQVKLLFLVFSGFILDGYFETFYALFRARDRMIFEGLARSLQGILAVIIALTIRDKDLSYLWAGASYPIRSALPFLLCLTASAKMTGWRFLLPSAAASVRDLLKKAAPLGLMGFLLVAAQRFDNTLVKALISDSAVAAWQQCYRLFEPMVLLVAPTLLPGALFADLCRAERSGWDQVSGRIRWMTEVFTVMAFMIVIPFFFLGTDILRTIWGSGYLRGQSFSDVQSSLRILMFGLPVTYLFHIYLAVILAQGRQKTVLPAVSAAFLVQITGLVLLLPRFGIVSAAIMQLIFIVTLTIWLGISTRKTYGETGFARGISRPAVALIPFALLALFQPMSPAMNMVASLTGFLLFWVLPGGGKAAARPPLSLSISSE